MIRISHPNGEAEVEDELVQIYLNSGWTLVDDESDTQPNRKSQPKRPTKSDPVDPDYTKE